MSIGDVLTLLRQEFPDVTISKIRFLESQGLVNPERTPSGYRKFYEHDVERLRWVLRQQREHFLPLKVIKDRLDDEPGEPEEAAPTHRNETGAVASAEDGPAPDGQARRDDGAPVRSAGARRAPVDDGAGERIDASRDRVDGQLDAGGRSAERVGRGGWTTADDHRWRRRPGANVARAGRGGCAGAGAGPGAGQPSAATTGAADSHPALPASRSAPRRAAPARHREVRQSPPRRHGAGRHPPRHRSPPASPGRRPTDRSSRHARRRPRRNGLGWPGRGQPLDRRALVRLWAGRRGTAGARGVSGCWSRPTWPVSRVSGKRRWQWPRWQPNSPGTESSPGTCACTRTPPTARPGFVEQIVLPLVRQRNPDARARAHETADELALFGTTASEFAAPQRPRRPARRVSDRGGLPSVGAHRPVPA